MPNRSKNIVPSPIWLLWVNEYLAIKEGLNTEFQLSVTSKFRDRGHSRLHDFPNITMLNNNFSSDQD